MCSKEEQEKLFEAVAKVKHDTGNIRQGLDTVNQHLKTLNGRTRKLEGQVKQLEDEEFREVRCVQRGAIDNIWENMLTVDKFEKWEREKEAKKEKQEKSQQRNMQLIISAIVGAGTIAMGIISFLQ